MYLIKWSQKIIYSMTHLGRASGELVRVSGTGCETGAVLMRRHKDGVSLGHTARRERLSTN